MKINYWAIPGLTKRPYLEGNDEIIWNVCSGENVTYEGIISKSRKRELVDARYIIAMLILKFKKERTNTIGHLINRDHSTVSHAKKMTKPRMPLHKKYKQYERELKKQIL